MVSPILFGLWHLPQPWCRLPCAVPCRVQAALEARIYRMTREAAMLRAQLAMTQNRPAVFPTEGPNEL